MMTSRVSRGILPAPPARQPATIPKEQTRGREPAPLELRPSEWLFCLFFVYALGLRVAHDPRAIIGVGAWPLLVPVILAGLARADARGGHPAWSMVRDWMAPLLILVAYWSIDGSAKPHAGDHLELVFIGWDRRLLDGWGVRHAIERGGPAVPAFLELTYLLLYAVPPLMVAHFYVRRERKRLEGFMFPFLLGTLTVYSLLPQFPSEAPRFAFPDEHLSTMTSALREVNVWILSRCDIRSSVFPSGHVGVGFSAALATWLSVKERRRIALGLFAFTLLVWIDTIYARYHYAADGLAALCASSVAIGAYAWYNSIRRGEDQLSVRGDRWREPASGTLRFAWRERHPLAGFSTGVSLHGHTRHSRESLAALPQWVSGVPIAEWELARLMRRYAARHGMPADLSTAYWTPPLSSLEAFELERSALERTWDVRGLVSLTDHDTVAAPSELLSRGVDVPISVEWTVPFDGTCFHLGVHNIPRGLSAAMITALASCTADPAEAMVRDVLEWLDAQPGILVVMNHPFWDQRGAGADQHRRALRRILGFGAGRIHAIELNGLRSWTENQAARELAIEWSLPIVSGGDRHGCEPNAVVNVTNAATFAEFVSEVRAGCSHVLFLPHYREPLRLRILRALYEVLHYQRGSEPQQPWTDRVFYTRHDEECPLSSVWPGGGPSIVRAFVGTVRVAGSETVQRPLRRVCAACGPAWTRTVTRA
jgi:membrane-associated phospholipid phosphatase